MAKKTNTAESTEARIGPLAAQILRIMFAVNDEQAEAAKKKADVLAPNGERRREYDAGQETS